MKESVKIESAIVNKVRKAAKKNGQTMSGYLEKAAQQALCPQYAVFDNSHAFIKYLDEKGIEHIPGGHTTILVNLPDPVSFGIEWGVYKYQNSPYYEKARQTVSKTP